MTDARFPERWLNDRRIQQLPSDAIVALLNAYMWSVSNRTDGVIKFADLELIPRCKPCDADTLTEVRLWKRRQDGWLLIDYAKTQRSRKQLDSDDEYRERERERVAAAREAKRAAAAQIQDGRANERANERDDNIGQGRTGTGQDALKRTDLPNASAQKPAQRNNHEEVDPGLWELAIQRNVSRSYEQ
jgi:hypothetical protein